MFSETLRRRAFAEDGQQGDISSKWWYFKSRWYFILNQGDILSKCQHPSRYFIQVLSIGYEARLPFCLHWHCPPCPHPPCPNTPCPHPPCNHPPCPLPHCHLCHPNVTMTWPGVTQALGSATPPKIAKTSTNARTRSVAATVRILHKDPDN